jgi:1-acyl-sn-glycerol-3-phosphate acyltransferase
MPELWYRCFFRFITRVYFTRMTLLHPERRPPPGQPVLYVGLHRNGAVDGFVYYRLLDEPTFLISTQLTRSWFARLFFHGIAVTRRKDEGDRQENEAALRHCVDHLRAGGKLLVFPEGTSSLGPRHLPFKSGAAWLLLDYLEQAGPPLQVIPVGIHYECPWAFRSKVELVLGNPVATGFAPESTRLERLKELKRRLECGLEEVGINVESDERQDQIQRLAYAATLATPRSYFESLKFLEKGVPRAVEEAESSLERERFLRTHSRFEPLNHAGRGAAGSPLLGVWGRGEGKFWPGFTGRAGARLLFHQGVPLVPMSPVWIYALALLVGAPIVAAALLVNLPPFLAGWFAGRKFPDDRNVISLWKILIGIPVFALWATGVVVVLLLKGKLLWLGLYVVVTWLGLALYYRVKKLAVAVHNGIRYPQLIPRLLAFRQTVLNALPE